MDGQPFLAAGVGITSSPSHSDIPGTPIMLIRPLGKLAKRYPLLATVTSSFSGVRYTLTELCMCTDYCRPGTGQIMMFPLGIEGWYGDFSSSDLGDLKCTKCGLVRPYRLTALNTA